MIFGDYFGPSYGSPYDTDHNEAFTGIGQAKERFRERMETSGSWALDVTYVKWLPADEWSEEKEVWVTVREAHAEFTLIDERVRFPATTTQDVIELYRSPDGDEPFARIVAGPRGGAVLERC